ncbi:hypothetical protein [Roseomonas genomospecies 6]|uniref:Uncharacterized protein n=1 Tax=Roseomonas genomospecies 6 TaxID=214106 RepID=A0A9W7KRT6_9PROT|nr:hypothetical protein [Roseomonas genomospecies 6]KAA0677471.1 hypothetical protein DS843_23075 [Roseomonas genomospecies 6]
MSDTAMSDTAMSDTAMTIGTLAEGEGLIRAGDPPRIVAEHAVFLFYPFRHGTASWPLKPTETLGSLAGQDWLPNIGGEPSDPKGQSLWKESPWPLTDLDPQVTEQLTVRDGQGALKVLALPSQRNIRKWLTGGQVSELRLRLPFSASARKRLERRGLPRIDSVGVDFGSIRLLPFRTGQGVLLVETRFVTGGPMPDTVLVEAATALCHDRGLEWRLTNGDHVPTRGGKDRFTLASLLGSLVQDTALQPLNGRRLFSYAFAAFDERLDDQRRDRLLVQLSRKYTDDYRIMDPLGDASHVRVFDTVAHAAYSEGCATVVERLPANGADKPPDFLTGFLKNAVEARYLGVAALDVHAREALLTLSRDSTFWPDMDNPSEEQIESLSRLQKQILAYRLRCRVSRVSPISMHNSFHEILSNAFRLDGILRDVNDDAQEIGTYLQERQAELKRESEKIWRLLIKMIAGASILSVVTDLLNFFGIKFYSGDAAIVLDFDSYLLYIVVLIFIFSFALFFAPLIFLRNSRDD